MQIDPKNSLQVAPINRVLQEQPLAEKTKTAHVNKTDVSSTQVSAFSRSLEHTFDSLSSHDGVDMNKVNQLKLAIANGELQLDADALISAMLEMHKR